ncbi:MAG: c-type cytochrome [Rhodospirillaceae bacterium]|nr:c-type cytochrome [Rhodospirillaceae bacterium]
MGPIRTIAVCCFVLASPGIAQAGALHDAAKAGDVAKIEQLLAEGADINQSTGLATPLVYAIREGHPDAAKLLIERGADVNASTNFGAPLHAAAGQGLATTAALLLERGADPNARSKELTPLHIAARDGSLEVAVVLLDHGADINAVTALEEPALHLAILNGHADVADLLLERGTKAPPVENVDALIATADVARGEQLVLHCRACHSFDREQKTVYGPTLWGIVGRPKASFGEYQYSPALKAVGGSWTYADLNRLIAQPAWTVPGIGMKMKGTHAAQDRADIIEYLRTLSDNPMALP